MSYSSLGTKLNTVGIWFVAQEKEKEKEKERGKEKGKE